MFMTLGIACLLAAGLFLVVADFLVPASLAVTCTAWAVHCWPDNRSLAVQCACIAALFLVGWLFDIRLRLVENRREKT